MAPATRMLSHRSRSDSLVARIAPCPSISGGDETCDGLRFRCRSVEQRVARERLNEDRCNGLKGMLKELTPQPL